MIVGELDDLLYHSITRVESVGYHRFTNKLMRCFGLHRIAPEEVPMCEREDRLTGSEW